MTPQLALNYQHTQSTAATVWTIDHHLGVYPMVDVYIDVDGGLQKIIPKAVTYVTPNQCTVTFSSAQSGVATVS